MNDKQQKALDHWAKVSKSANDIVEFLDWLDREYGLELDWTCANPGTPLGITNLVNEFLGVDEAALESARRELLEQCRRTPAED